MGTLKPTDIGEVRVYLAEVGRWIKGWGLR